MTAPIPKAGPRGTTAGQDVTYGTMLLRLKQETLMNIRREATAQGWSPDATVRACLEGAFPTPKPQTKKRTKR